MLSGSVGFLMNCSTSIESISIPVSPENGKRESVPVFDTREVLFVSLAVRRNSGGLTNVFVYMRVFTTPKMSKKKDVVSERFDRRRKDRTLDKISGEAETLQVRYHAAERVQKDR